MCTFARENDTRHYELYIYITPFPAYLLGILPPAEAERREGAGHCRRDIYQYVHSHEEVLSRYGDRIVMCERMPELFSAAMGQQMYTVRLQTMEEVNEFVKFVHEKKL